MPLRPSQLAAWRSCFGAVERVDAAGLLVGAEPLPHALSVPLKVVLVEASWHFSVVALALVIE